MLKKLMPIVLLLMGSGAGVGAGIFLRPPATLVDEVGSHEGGGTNVTTDEDSKEGTHSAKVATDGHHDENGDGSGLEYVKLNNQFVVPIVKDRRVTALVVMGLSLGVPEGNKDIVYQREPKVRDSILQVLFDHANVGGFDGAFTDAGMMEGLRRALREVAQRDLGRDAVKDVLILEIARQDY
jgi:hypothetical protein